MFLPPRVRSTRPISRHAQRSATLNALPLRLSQAKPFSVAAKKIRIGCGPRSRYGHCRRAILHCSSEDAASIPKSGLEIKNRCTQEGINRQNLASIRKSGLEIKNRCMQQAIFSTRSLDESLWR